ncbi:flavodoxin [Ruminiclostridium papyrosolvens]|uniref:Flavodoxin n=1 Tax=Ruminiclostridium papyrosolvens C7 TaxID=1330534 RepID=U4R7B3_9FIRM|nr:flavodoxin [Ruminiclostridium papyrosolvens]EPR14388.1 flavodoxin [Ruminiclostridium papyrosolvens C7]
MKNIIVIFWSGTGNTQKMAMAVAEGAGCNDTQVIVKQVSDATVDDVLNADVVALGCPSMGCEVLEETEMEPFIESLEQVNLKDKKMVLFGSYDWGTGQWMEDWSERMTGLGAILVTEGLIIHTEPDDIGILKCKELGKKLFEA